MPVGHMGMEEKQRMLQKGFFQVTNPSYIIIAVRQGRNLKLQSRQDFEFPTWIREDTL